MEILKFNYFLLCCRAAQKWNLSSSPHRRRRSGDENITYDDHPIFPNGYAAILNKSPPPAPPAFLRRIGVKELTGVGKVILILLDMYLNFKIISNVTQYMYIYI